MAGELSEEDKEALAGGLNQVAFEVRVGPLNGEHRIYRVWANGVTEGFQDGDATVMVINKIPQLMRQAEAGVWGRMVDLMRSCGVL